MAAKTRKHFSGSICGGLINESTFNKDPMSYMMAYVMPDKQFDRYQALLKEGKHEKAAKLSDRYAHSVI